MTRDILLFETDLLEALCLLDETSHIQDELIKQECLEDGYNLFDRLCRYVSIAIKHRYKSGQFKNCKDEMFEYINDVFTHCQKVSNLKVNTRCISLYLMYMNSCKYDVSINAKDRLDILDFLLNCEIIEDNNMDIKINILKEKIEVLLSAYSIDVDELLDTNRTLKDLLRV